MIVVADASPLRYLIIIEHSHVLPELYGSVLVPPVVVAELQQERTPAAVHAWMARAPEWLRVQAASRERTSVNEALGAGERAAIALADELSADALLIDDRDGRMEAERHGIPVLGTLRVLADAAEHGLADLHVAIDRLRRTNFRASEQLIQLLLDRARRRP